MEKMERRTLYVVSAVALGILVAILPLIFYPITGKETTIGALLLQKVHPRNGAEDFEQMYALEKPLSENLIQASTVVAIAAVLGFIFWIYAKRTI